MRAHRLFWRLYCGCAVLLSGAALSGCPKYGEPEPATQNYGQPPASSRPAKSDSQPASGADAENADSAAGAAGEAAAPPPAKGSGQ